ncbi:hypothetical protein SAMN04487976_112160, partial [Xaviernesmea oryzae]
MAAFLPCWPLWLVGLIWCRFGLVLCGFEGCFALCFLTIEDGRKRNVVGGVS